MNKKYPKTEETGNKNPYKVPEGYFDELNQNILNRLDEVTVEMPETISLWNRVKPWVYMAAMFIGIALMFKVFSGDFNPSSDKLAKSESIRLQQNYFEDENYEEVYDYLEYQTIKHNYRESVYISEN